MTIESYLEEIHSRGWHLYTAHNLPYDRPAPFQWEVTLRYEAGPDSLVTYGQGPSFALALALAIDNIDRAQPHILPTIVAYDEPAVDLTKVLANLRPAVKLTRRV